MTELSAAVTLSTSVLGKRALIGRHVATLDGFIKNQVQRSVVIVLGTARELASYLVTPPYMEF